MYKFWRYLWTFPIFLIFQINFQIILYLVKILCGPGPQSTAVKISLGARAPQAPIMDRLRLQDEEYFSKRSRNFDNFNVNFNEFKLYKFLLLAAIIQVLILLCWSYCISISYESNKTFIGKDGARLTSPPFGPSMMPAKPTRRCCLQVLRISPKTTRRAYA